MSSPETLPAQVREALKEDLKEIGANDPDMTPQGMAVLLSFVDGAGVDRSGKSGKVEFTEDGHEVVYSFVDEPKGVSGRVWKIAPEGNGGSGLTVVPSPPVVVPDEGVEGSLSFDDDKYGKLPTVEPPTQVMLFRYDYQETQCLGRYVDFTSAYNAALRHHAREVWGVWTMNETQPGWCTPREIADQLYIINEWKPTLEAAFDKKFQSVGEANDFLDGRWECPKLRFGPSWGSYAILSDYPHEVMTVTVDEARADLWSDSENQGYKERYDEMCRCSHGWKVESAKTEMEKREEWNMAREKADREVIDHVALNIEAMERMDREREPRRAAALEKAKHQRATELEEALKKEIHWREFKKQSER